VPQTALAGGATIKVLARILNEIPSDKQDYRDPRAGNLLEGGFKFERKHHLTTLERMVRWQEIAYD
jgi:hypothetical protein